MEEKTFKTTAKMLLPHHQNILHIICHKYLAGREF